MSGSDCHFDDIVQYKFHQPVAPLVASGPEGVDIDVHLICSRIDKLSKDAFLLIEGAGGLLVPITKTCSYADIAKQKNLGLVIVVGSELGAINQALMTFEVAQKRGLNVLGYVFNDLFFIGEGKEDEALKTNRTLLKTLADSYGVEELGYLSNIPDLCNDSAQDLSLEQVLSQNTTLIIEHAKTKEVQDMVKNLFLCIYEPN